VDAAAAAAAEAASNADSSADASLEASANADSTADDDSNASADDDSNATADDDSSASADADGDASGLTATVKYERIVRGTGVIQEVYGTGFEAGESVTATVNSTPFTLTANADQNGNVVFSFAVGNDFELGAHHAILVGAVSGEVPDANTDTDFVVVTAGGSGGPGGSGGNNLPDTGSSLPIGFAIGAVLLLLLGGAALWLSKIRRGNAA
jgi:LPXTG-motif cell wall-anchored protein